MAKNAAFWKAAVNRGAQVLISLLLLMAMFFLSAERSDLPLAWIYFGLYFVSLIMNMVVFLKYNPEVIAARSEILKGEMKWWDKVYAWWYMLSALAIPLVCGLDVKYNSTVFGIEYYIVGIIMFIIGWSFTSWALIVNKFFEGAVRIQKERGHKVISTGPYAIVRHPDMSE